MMSKIRTGILAAGVAALITSQTAYAAPAVASAAIDPLVSLSMLASTASRAAVCAGSSATTAAAATAAAQTPAPNCVLPVAGTPPPVVTPAGPPPVVPVSEAPKSIGILPILLGLAALAGIIALLLSDDDDNGSPVSPG